jgi:UDP-N-acetylmuramyl tripeptide synthase
MSLRRQLAVRAVGVVNGLSRRIGRGQGTVAGGRVGLRLDPSLLKELSEHRSIVLISGTNGKTTTTALVAAAVAPQLGSVASNASGSNMPPGHVAALCAAPGALAAVLEVDESYLPLVLEATAPRVIVLLNLSRDQLDRTNEVRMIAERWRWALASAQDTVVVANADDPLVAFAAWSAPQPVWVGGGLVWREDASGCPSCSARIAFEPDGSWSCERCALHRPSPSWQLKGDLVSSPVGEERLDLNLPGAFNRANALMALAAASSLGVSLDQALEGLSTVSDVAGRFHQIIDRAGTTRVMLAKNPAGWSALLDLVVAEQRPVVVGINARTADGLDPSWLFDVPFARLAGRNVIATGDRWRDLSVRLHYADVVHEVEPDPRRAIDRAHRYEAEVDYVGNYTAFQDVIRAQR